MMNNIFSAAVMEPPALTSITPEIISITKVPGAGPMKHLLKLQDLSEAKLSALLDSADRLKKEKQQGINYPYLKGKTLGMIFEKASTRTRISFEAGMYQLGGSALFLSSNDLQIGRGEPIEDTARVLSRYLDGVMIRTFSQQMVETLAAYSSIPVINGLTDYAHPCQVLADLMTIREYKGRLNGLKMAYIGDGNNMANSLMAGAALTGIELTIACPEGYHPDPELTKWAQARSQLLITDSPEQAVCGADIVYTDVWSSMGQESEVEKRRIDFAGYQVNQALMEKAQPGAMVMHCLPAHRGEEISAETLESHANEIFDQVENRLHAQKAVLLELLG